MKSELLDFICFLGKHDGDDGVVGVEGEEGVVRDGQDCGRATKVDVSYVRPEPVFLCQYFRSSRGARIIR